MDLELIHNRLFFLANKEKNYWTPEEIDAKLHMASIDRFDHFKPAYGKTQEATDALTPFKVKKTFTTSNTPGGLISFNTDYFHFLGGYVQYLDNTAGKIVYEELRQINEDELGGRLNSQITPVAAETPVYTTPIPGQLQLYPEEPNTGYCWYLQTPEPPNFVFTMEGRTKVYNKSNSTQMLWNESCVNQIIIKTLQYLGVNIQAEALVQYTELEEQKK